MEISLEVKNLYKYYKDNCILENINIEINKKEFVGIIGKSGSGKSTLLKIIAGIEKPTQGEVILQGRKIDSPTYDISYLFQDYRLFPWLNVIDNVTFYIRNIDISASKFYSLYERTLYYMEILGIAQRSKSYPYELSGGLKQRVALCRALSTSPKVLLLDEPSSALDMFTAITSWTLLRRIFLEVRDTIFIVVSHNLDEVTFLCDRIIVLGGSPGKVIDDIRVPRSSFQEDISLEYMFSEEFINTKKIIAHKLFSSNEDKLIKLDKDDESPLSYVQE